MVAPYFSLLAKWSNATIDSIYRGDDAIPILNAHGKHSQGQLYRAWEKGEGAKFGILGKPNPPGQSTHELRSDGVAYRGPIGRKLEWWQQGVDVNDSDVEHMILHARRHGWDLFQPYKSGVEFHHLNFRSRPRPKGFDRIQVIHQRAILPRR